MLISSIKKQLPRNWTAGHLMGVITLSFNLMGISVLNLHAMFKVLYHMGMELLDFEIVLVKSIDKCNSGSQNTPVSHVSCRKLLPACVQLHLPVLQTTRAKCRYCYTAGIEIKTHSRSNVIHVEFFCAWFPAIDLETVLQILVEKFQDNKNFLCCCSFIASLSFTLGLFS